MEADVALEEVYINDTRYLSMAGMKTLCFQLHRIWCLGSCWQPLFEDCWDVRHTGATVNFQNFQLRCMIQKGRRYAKMKVVF